MVSESLGSVSAFSDSGESESNTPVLDIRELTAAYGDRPVLKGVTLRVSSGDRLLVVGPNGAGKSTLLKAITGLLPRVEGALSFRGRDFFGGHVTTSERINSGIGYLLQGRNLVPDLTAGENLELAAYPAPRRIALERRSRALAIFPLLRESVDSRAGTLSSGQRQLLAIAMVLMKEPLLLLLDEPTAGLAPKTAADTIAQVAPACEAFGVEAVCMVEHNLRLVLPWANKLAVLVGGRVEHLSDSPAEYLRDPEELERFFFHRT